MKLRLDMREGSVEAIADKAVMHAVKAGDMLLFHDYNLEYTSTLRVKGFRLRADEVTDATYR